MARVARALAIGLIGCSALTGCKKHSDSPAVEQAAPRDIIDGASSASMMPAIPDAGGPQLAATSMATLIYEKPDLKSTRLGYLRLGAIVDRAPAPAGTERCPKGWYAIRPRGYVCLSRGATLDVDEPVVRAAKRRPDTTLPLPYPYVFVRAVAPQYLRVPNEEEQEKTEFKLRQHLGYWGRHAHAGAPPLGRRSTEMSVGQLLGGEGNDDPPPFWLDGGRRIANVAAFQAAPNKIFSERVRRHTGLAVVGSWVAGPEALKRRFSVTVDLRLVPADKLKPDTGSPFRGVELTPELGLPIAFVRDGCNPKKQIPCAHVYKLDDDEVHQLLTTLPYRAVVRLSGKKRTIGSELYHETSDGKWLRARDIGVAEAPTDWPLGAKSGKKWVEVSILNETLVLWEGQKPVYATLISAGQDGLKDPKTTKSTVLGVFRIFNKQITATMDSNERASTTGATSSASTDNAEAPNKADKPLDSAVDPKKARATTESADDQEDHPESPFELRDVPYVQYFESGYALHAAYWHDAFGTARSHGCVNLSPIDAQRLFFWTDPPVPDGWHGVSVPTGEGTMVVVHK